MMAGLGLAKLAKQFVKAVCNHVQDGFNCRVIFEQMAEGNSLVGMSCRSQAITEACQCEELARDGCP